MSDPFTIIGLNGQPMVVTEEQLSALPFDTLWGLRQRNPTQSIQATLAPIEHRVFAQEYTREHPWAAPALALATPAYAGAKGMGYESSDPLTTAPTFRQVGQGLMGVAEGLGGATMDAVNAAFGRKAAPGTTMFN